jgi:hypothetical protein
MLDRPRRQAALTAMENVRSVLEWETMPESSTKFQEIAAEFDRQFAEERQLTQTTDMPDVDDCYDTDEASVDSEEEAMDQDDMDFIDNEDDEYTDSDKTFELSEDEELSTSSEESQNNDDVLEIDAGDLMPKSPTSSIFQCEIDDFYVEHTDGV